MTQEPEQGDTQGQNAQSRLIAAQVPGRLDGGTHEAQAVVRDALIAPGHAPQPHECGADDADRVAQVPRKRIQVLAISLCQKPVELLENDDLVVNDLLEDPIVLARMRMTDVSEVAGVDGEPDLGAQVHHPLVQCRPGRCLITGSGQPFQGEVSDGDEHVEAGQDAMASLNGCLSVCASRVIGCHA